MRVLMISKACIVGTYQRKLEELARCGVELTVIVPPEWRDPSGTIRLERVHTQGYRLLVEPMQFNGNFHLHRWPTLAQRIAEIQPEIVHIDEEPYNLATWQALRLARKHGAKALFFSWQNLVRRYPPPFAWIERWVLNTIDYALMGTESAAEVWRAKGYCGRLAVIPQFGIDPDFFIPLALPTQRLSEKGMDALTPVPSPAGEGWSAGLQVPLHEGEGFRVRTSQAGMVRIGYVGRLVPEKGVDVLLRALAGLPGDWRAEIVGQGPERATLEALAAALGLSARMEFTGQVPSTALPDVYRRLDVLVIPSLSRPNWKEQFGRVILEANACGVPVIGSDSGAIPGLIGRGGLTFPEGDSDALRAHLARLIDQPAERVAFGKAGREQVLAQFTHAQIAAQTAAVYREMVTKNA